MPAQEPGVHPDANRSASPGPDRPHPRHPIDSLDPPGFSAPDALPGPASRLIDRISPAIDVWLHGMPPFDRRDGASVGSIHACLRLIFRGRATPLANRHAFDACAPMVSQVRKAWTSTLISRSPRPIGRLSGFTLIELLVVISVIGTLIALLMPA